MTTPAQSRAAKVARYPMKLIEGFRGISRKVKFSYRGHFIFQEFRPHDVRNKTHNGYWWSVAFNDGKSIHGLTTRSDAKAAIDLHARSALQQAAQG